MNLQEAITEYHRWVLPLSEQDESQINQILEKFLHTPATQEIEEILQHQLRREGNQLWQSLYFQNKQNTRQISPLNNQFAGLIEWNSTQTGLKRVSRFIASLLVMHKNHLEEFDFLRGSKNKNAITETANRNFLILYRGCAWSLDASDEKSTTATPVQIENTLYKIIHEKPNADDLPFSAYSLADERKFEAIKGVLRGENRETWNEVTNALFCVAIDDIHQYDVQDALAAAAFSDVESFITHKPINYRCNIIDDRYFLHSESSWLIWPQITPLIARAQEIFDEKLMPRRNLLNQNLNARRLHWRMNESLQEIILAESSEFLRQAEELTCTHCDVFLSEEFRQLFNQFEHKALIQIILVYAYWRTYRRFDSLCSYEYSENLNAMQLVSDEAKKLIMALENSAINHTFEDYLHEYQRRRDFCYAISPYSYLQGFVQLARNKREDIDFPMLKCCQLGEAAQLRIIGDEAHTLKNIAMNPLHGLALSYSVRRNNVIMLISHRRNKVPEVQRFIREIKYSFKKMLRLLLEAQEI